MKRVLLLVVLFWLVTACAPDPRQQAQADQIRSEAQQNALNAEAQRNYQQELNQVDVQKQQLEQAQREATAAEWNRGWNMLIHYGFFVATAALCFIIFMATRSMAKSFVTMSEGISSALVRAAEVRANQIPLDPVTRQYPIFLQYMGHGQFSATNFNVNSTLLLDTRNEPDRQMIAEMGAVQYAGALAQAAQKSDDPAGMSLIQAPVMDVKTEALSVGKDMLGRRDE